MPLAALEDVINKSYDYIVIGAPPRPITYQKVS